MKHIIIAFLSSIFFLTVPVPVLGAVKTDVDVKGNANVEVYTNGERVYRTTQQSSNEQISEFSSEITINSDASITIKEIINYFSPVEKHGIYRYIPYEYNRDGKEYITDIYNFSVTDEMGGTIPFTVSREGGSETYKIGDPNRTFRGKKTYVLTYSVSHALTRFEDHDELYWDITGEGWTFPIAKTQATVISPHTKITKTTCYTGLVGGDDSLCQFQSTDTNATFSYPYPIDYGRNMTVVVALEQNGAITFPAPIIKPKISWQLVVGLLFLPMIALAMMWYFWGRDYVFLSPNIYDMDDTKTKKLQSVFAFQRTPFVYEPFKTITPGEAGTVLDENTDNRDVIAEIIDLARKHYLKIEAVEKKGFLGIGGGVDYKFIKLKETTPEMPKHQSYLHEHLFEDGDEVLLSDLKGEFYGHMQETKKLLYESVTKQKMFTHNPKTARVAYISLGVVLFVIVGSILYALAQFAELEYPEAVLVSIPSVFGMLFFATHMPQKTAVGTNMMLQAKGLREMIKHGKWRQEIAEKRLFIEEVLPFAISLGVVHQLAKVMSELNIPAPTYVHNAMLTNMTMNSFIHSFSSQTVSNLSYNPSSSSWSGRSGFSGGSSGGGGGGGGGGSW